MQSVHRPSIFSEDRRARRKVKAVSRPDDDTAGQNDHEHNGWGVRCALARTHSFG